ncbi:MAG: hypothetical protein COV52_08275 [Gammaproteobacteria bacterium CG11_big_fil_rev_8_21_14_0_20_46_22]|nr:MAG: hypothetical protein COW05_06280 [Gammaproteobacteria bacterium CG12_big_fil_rev_8_21_14_0_65_46_12]PIR10603.1 MAG: hypothetical protein COV52_08275 [Gammaproteobacteria bacterium CG11_big_fil_rev_8_21_14_0_20_46_22]
MNIHTLGEITLSISTIIYFIWFLPQLWLNFKRKDTEGLSYWMHGLLLFGYMADLMYGFGRDMQWQYRLVTIVGLASLFIEHYQIGRYGLHSKSEVISYALITLVFLGLLGYAIDNVSFTHRSKHFYDTAGMVSNVCWFTYMLPQIIKNYLNKSTEGLSLYFVLIAVLITVCDLTSAIALNWDWPSLVGAPLTLLKKSVLLFQCWWYRGRRLKR